MFYVYVYRDPRPTKCSQPVYVGKGTGDRDISHWSRGSHNKPFQDFISHLKLRGLISTPERVFETECEQEAFAKEVELITLYGRRVLGTGTLFNRTDGGEGPSGYTKTKAEKEVDRITTKAHWRDPAYRAKVTATQRISQNTPERKVGRAKNSRQMWAEQGASLAKKIKKARNTLASKEKTSVAAKAMWADPEYAAKQTANNKELSNRPEVKAAKAAAAKALWADPVWREAMMAARKKPIATNP